MPRPSWVPQSPSSVPGKWQVPIKMSVQLGHSFHSMHSRIVQKYCGVSAGLPLSFCNHPSLCCTL